MEKPDFEKVAGEHIKKVAEQHAKALDDGGIDSKEKEDLADIRKQIKEFLEESYEERELRGEALYQAIVKITEDNPEIEIDEICEWVFGNKGKEIFVLWLGEVLNTYGEFHPALIHLRLLFSAIDDPSEALIYADKYKDQPYAKGVWEKAARTAAEKDPAAALRYADEYKDQPYAKEILEKAARTAAEKNPGMALLHAGKYRDKSYAKEVIEKAARTAAEKDPSAALWYAYEYKAQPYAEEIIDKAIRPAVKESQAVAFSYFYLYKDRPYAKDVILTAIEEDPSNFFINADLNLDKPYVTAETIEKAARVASEREPSVALEYARFYENQPYAKEVIEKAVRAAVGKDPSAALKYAGLYKDQLYAKEIIEKAARAAIETDPSAVLCFADCYIDQPYAKEIITAAADKNPEAALKYAGNYANQPYAKEVIINAAELYPWGFVENPNYLGDLFGSELDPLTERYTGYINMIKKPELEYFLSSVMKSEDFLLGIKALYLSIVSAERDHSLYNRFIGIPLKDFERIFSSEAAQNLFKAHAGEYTYMNAVSICKATYRKIIKEWKPVNDETIREALTAISEEREKASKRELFGPNTKLILFNHKEERFDGGKILKKIWERSGGKDEDVVANEKGVQMEGAVNKKKENILQAIKNIKSPTTILFNGHGSPENWEFAYNRADDLNHFLVPSPTAINYQELGDALIASGHITDVNLIGATCFSYDFLMNLFTYLESKGVKEKPYVSIAEANKNKTGMGGGYVLDSRFLEAFYKVTEDGEPVTVNHFFKIEGLIWRHVDPALFVGAGEEVTKEFPPAEALPKRFFEIGGDNKNSGYEQLS